LRRGERNGKKRRSGTDRGGHGTTSSLAFGISKRELKLLKSWVDSDNPQQIGR